MKRALHQARVSTHSRPKAAGSDFVWTLVLCVVSTHSRPKAAGLGNNPIPQRLPVSTHSRPKAAGCTMERNCISWVRFNTQPPEGGWCPFICGGRLKNTFQHTAARRRLATISNSPRFFPVFQHTAARRRLELFKTEWVDLKGFNTQPPEGGWSIHRGQ